MITSSVSTLISLDRVAEDNPPQNRNSEVEQCKRASNVPTVHRIIGPASDNQNQKHDEPEQHTLFQKMHLSFT